MTVTLEDLAELMKSTVTRHEAASAKAEGAADMFKAKFDAQETLTEEQNKTVMKHVTELSALQADIATIKAAMAILEDGGTVKLGGQRKAAQRAGSLFVESEEYKDWVKTKARSNQGSSVLELSTRDLFCKDDDFMAIGSNAGGLSPQYHRVPTDRPVQGPVVQDFCTTIDIGDVESVRSARQQASYELITRLTAAVVTTDTLLPVERLAGFSTDAAYSTIVITDPGGLSETRVVSALTPDDADDPTGPGTLTVLALTNGYAKGKFVTAARFLPTLEAQYKPQHLDVYAEVFYPVAKIAKFIEASKEVLEDGGRVDDLIQRRLLRLLEKAKDYELFYGIGGNGRITGAFNDTDVPSFLWSASAAGSSKLDFIIDLLYSVRASDHIPNVVFVATLDHRDMTKAKGSDGHYILARSPEGTAISTVIAVPIVATNNLNVGDVIAGDFANAVTIFMRETAEILVGQPGQQFKLNMFTILAEFRMAFAIDHPLGLAIGEFDSAP